MKVHLALVWLILATPPVAAADPDTTLGALRRGEWQQVEQRLAADPARGPFESRLLIELLDRRGDRDGARLEASRLLRRYGLSDLPPVSHYHAAFAAAYLQQWEEANEIFLRASQTSPVPRSLYVDWAHLYLEKYNPAEAETILREGLEREPVQGAERWSLSDLHLALARALKDLGSPAFAASLEEAVQADPANPDVRAYQAWLTLQDENWDEAGRQAAEALKITPGHLHLSEIAAAAAHFGGSAGEAAAALAALQRINPLDAAYYEMLGDLSVGLRRMDEAVSHYTEALRLDPRRWSALAARGINLLRMGREDEGVADLERAYQNDPYNIWTVNTLRLVDSFGEFERFETEHFTVRIHQEEAAVLRPYVEELLERSLATLQERYEHRIPHRVIFEMYPDHEDFAVRTLGLPGLGALGATFGRVVAMDSPSARPRGRFHWASTLWHELAHVVTLSLSGNRVPRWLTEGISMMEERLAGPGWGDPITIQFVEAWRAGRLLPIRDLNSGFIRPDSPEQVAISYLQAGRLCDFLLAEYGLPKLRRLLRAYGEGLETEEAFRQALGKSVEDVDQAFRSDLAREMEPLARALERPPAVEGETSAMEAALAATPANFYLNFSLASRYYEHKRLEEAIPLLRRAIASFPWAVEESGPYGLLVEILTTLQREEEAVQVLSEWWQRSPLLAANALRLARRLISTGRAQEALPILEQALYADPLSPELHRRLGELYLEMDRPPAAVREFRALLALNPSDQAEAHYLLAEALLRHGDRENARREVLLALEIAPGFEEAQRLLLKVVRQ
jgi:tetratricopeptide (TPR) repeat protein